MEVNLESLISYEKLKTDIDGVFKVIEKNGKVVILKENEPVYILLKYDRNSGPIEKILGPSIPKRNLHLKKDGTQAKYNQIRARCGHYPDMFESLPRNIIQLKRVLINGF